MFKLIRALLSFVFQLCQDPSTATSLTSSKYVIFLLEGGREVSGWVSVASKQWANQRASKIQSQPNAIKVVLNMYLRYFYSVFTKINLVMWEFIQDTGESLVLSNLLMLLELNNISVCTPHMAIMCSYEKESTCKSKSVQVSVGLLLHRQSSFWSHHYHAGFISASQFILLSQLDELTADANTTFPTAATSQ